MAYIGQSLVEGTRRVYNYTATASQTTFHAVYQVGVVDVYKNGLLLAPDTYTATDGANIVLDTGASVGDKIAIHCHNTFSVTDTVPASGGSFTGDVTMQGNLNVQGTTTTLDSASAQTVDLGDNDKIRLGDGNDLELYHDSSNNHSFIRESGTGDLRILGDNISLRSTSTDEPYINIATNGAVTLYYDNAAKFATTSSGIDVSGGIVASPNTAGKDTFQLSTHAVDEGRLRIKNVDTTTVEIRAGGVSYFNGGNIGVNTNSPVDFGANFRNLNLNGIKGGALNFTRGTNSATRQWDIYTNDTDKLIFYRAGTTDTMVLTPEGHLGIGTATPADSSWGHATYGNTEVAIDGGGGYGVLHFRGDGAGSTEARYTMGVGDGNFYMAYDDVAANHRMTINANGQLGIGRQPTSSYKLDLHNSLSGNWLAHIHNSHATNGYGVKIRAGDDNNVTAFRVSSQDNNTTILDCAGGGIVTTPNQPYFNVTKNGSSYTAANNVTLVFDRVMSNVGSHYSSSTGRFTAPVTGKYLFLFQSITQGNYNNASIRIFKNGARFYGSDIHFSPYLSATNYWDHVSNNQIISLNAGDYVEVKNVGPTVTYHGDHWAHFTGMLLG